VKTDDKYYEVTEAGIKVHSTLGGARGQKLCNSLQPDVQWTTHTRDTVRDETNKCLYVFIPRLYSDVFLMLTGFYYLFLSVNLFYVWS